MTSLTVYIDFKSPHAYLALKPTLALLDEDWASDAELQIDWRPFAVKAPAPPAARKADETVSERHFRVRDEYNRATLHKYADIQGIEMSFPEQGVSTDLALATLANIDGDRSGFVAAAFNALWRDGGDLNDPEVLARLSADVPAPENVAGILAAAHEAADEDGVIEAPAYVVDEALFIGRAHLPWIRQILSDS